MTLKTTSAAVVKRMQLPRKPEFDALRGLFLVWTTLTHLPTRLSDLVNQPFGFVSSAEGFVFLSALLVGRVYMRQALESTGKLRGKLWKHALRVYAYHVVLSLLAFTFAAAFAVYRHHAALEHLLLVRSEASGFREAQQHGLGKLIRVPIPCLLGFGQPLNEISRTDHPADAQPRERDRIFQFGDVRVFVDPKSFIYLHGMTLDYQETLMQQGFVFVNPQASKSCGCGTSFSA